jgi:hypothetical protein
MNYHISILPSDKKTINKKELLQTKRWYFVCNNDTTMPNEYNCEKYKNFQSAIECYNANPNAKLISTLAKPITKNREPSRKLYKFNDTDVFFYN